MTRTVPRPSLPKRPARPARPSVPPLPTFEALDATHLEVMRTLERLQQWVEQLDPQRVDDAMRATADEICKFFDGHAREHHAAEEQHVFPSLLASGDAVLVLPFSAGAPAPPAPVVLLAVPSPPFSLAVASPAPPE